jgi:hypothetical protein
VLALTLVTAAALSSCGTHPGSAAVVGSQTISDGRVDDVATALCAISTESAQAGQPQELATRSARQVALGVLIDSALTRQFGEAEGIEPDQEQVSAALASFQATIDAVPAAERAVFRDVVTQDTEGRLVLTEVGRRALAEAGRRNATDQQAVATATRLRNRWAAENVDVSVDPRYGTYARNALTSRSGSLSVAVSSDAAAGAEATPATSWVASLPASQKCP